MSTAVRMLVRQRATGRCEYCQLSQVASLLSFHIEHVIAVQHGGESVEGNLALACPHCNLHKEPNLTGIDPISGRIEHLFNPRTDDGKEHFRFHEDRIHGLTPRGRTTLGVLAFNDDEQLELRRMFSIQGRK